MNTKNIQDMAPVLKNTSGQTGVVLVAEEDEMSRHLITLLLERNQVKFKLVHTIMDVLHAIYQDEFSLLIVGVDGPGVLVKNLPGLIDNLPIVALATESFRNDPSAKYYTSVLYKPYTEKELMQLINQYMKKDLPNNNKTDDTADISFSLEPLQRIGNNDEGFILKMLEKFVSTAGACTSDMESAIAANARDKVRMAAHKNIPSYSLMGLNPMAKALEHLEHNSTDANVPELVNAFIKQNERVIQEVENCIKQLKQKKEN
jgi:HPt (histidine-containing phosphotransfer) domain-containing protein/CheY-like chemotaxis protein